MKRSKMTTTEQQQQQQDDEEAVFDRQTRLWGADAQQKIRSSRVLITGKFQGLAAELCKNLVLAGVNVSIQDDDLVQEEDILGNIFLRGEDVGKPRAASGLSRLREMNPFASVLLVGDSDMVSVKDFKLVVSVGETFANIEAMAETCRKDQVPFIAARTHGMLAFALLDLGEQYTFTVEGGKKDQQQEQQQSTVSFPSMKSALHFKEWDTLPKGRAGFPFAIFAIWIAREMESLEVQGDSPKKQQEKKAKTMTTRERVEEVVQRNRGHDVVRNIDDVARAVDIIHNRGTHHLAAVCTINGGLIGQECLKVVSGQGAPIMNIMVFDAMDAACTVRLVPPPRPK